MSQKVCFVIMPYGGEDEKLRKHYLGVYESLIKPAAQAAGYVVKRSDISGAPGDITKDVIQDLSTADLVIADLSSANPNVFFELGIRHALRKSGTIHIVNREHHIPFDIRQYRYIQYTTDLAELPTAIGEIHSAAEKRIQQPDRSDNPVHDALPHLPTNVAEVGVDERLGQLQELQERIETLSDENDELAARVEHLQKNPRAQVEQDIDASFDEADRIIATTGQNVLLRLANVAEHGGKEQFSKELRDAIKSSFLDENDFMAIANLCTELNLEPHRVAVLREALNRFPESREFFSVYVRALIASPSRERKLEGVRLAEERYGIVREGESLTVTHADRVSDVQELLGLVDFYLNNGKAGWTLQLLSAIEGKAGNSALFLRNKARALGKLHREDEAEEIFRDAIRKAPNDDTLFAFYSDFLDDVGRHEDAYVQCEHALRLDPSDGTRYRFMAIQILNRGYCRDDQGGIQFLQSRGARVRAAVPFIIGSVYRATINRDVNQAVTLLVRERLVGEAETLLRGEVPSGEFDLRSYSYVFPEDSMLRTPPGISITVDSAGSPETFAGSGRPS